MEERRDTPAGRYGAGRPILAGLACATFTCAGLLMAGEPADRSETVVWVPTRMLARHVVHTSARDILRESRYAVGPMPGIHLADANQTDAPSMQGTATPGMTATRLSHAALPSPDRESAAENHAPVEEEPRLAWIERITQASSLPNSFVEGMKTLSEEPGLVTEAPLDAESDLSTQMMARTKEHQAHMQDVLNAAASGVRPEASRHRRDSGHASPTASEPSTAASTVTSVERQTAAAEAEAADGKTPALQRAVVEPIQPVRAPATVPAGRLLCIGDCVTLGEWWEEDIGYGTRWVDLLAERSPSLHAINAGRDGLETRHVWYLREMLRTHPHVDTVILSLGVNDLRGTNRVDGARVSRARSNMAEMIDEVRKVKPEANILLASPVGIAPEHLSRRWQDEQFGLHTLRMLEMMAASYEALAREKGVVFVDLTHTVPTAHLPDGVHPDQTGHAAIARTFWEALGGEPEAGHEKQTTFPVAAVNPPPAWVEGDDAAHAGSPDDQEDLRALAVPAQDTLQHNEVILPPVASPDELAAAMEDASIEEILLELRSRGADPFAVSDPLPSPEHLMMDALYHAENGHELRQPEETRIRRESVPVPPEAVRTRPHPESSADTVPQAGRGGSIEDFLSGLRDQDLPELEPSRMPRHE